MNEFTVIFNNFSATLFPVFVNVTWQFALLVSCVWLVIKVGWVRSAPTQHSLWLLCVFSPILLVTLGVLMPNTNLLLKQQKIAQPFKGAPIPAEYSILERNNSVTEGALERNDSVVASTLKRNGSVTADTSERNDSAVASTLKGNDSVIANTFWLSYAPMIMMFVWIVGVGFSLLRLGWGVFGLRKLRKNAKPIISGPFRELLESLKTQMEVRRSVVVAASQHVHAPISLGIWRPVILLPTAINSLATNEFLEKVKLAFIHELAHIRRHDALINWCQQIFNAFCFLHPLFHLASRCLTQVREHLCDNWVIQQSGKRGEYAAFLAGLLEAATSKGVARAISLAVIPTKYSVVRRINVMLEHRNTIKTKLSRKMAFIILFAGLLTILLLSATRILPMPSIFPQTQGDSIQALGTFSENEIIADEEIETYQENPQHGTTEPNLSGTIKNRSVLFKNREELVRSRKPGPDCHGVAVHLVHVTIHRDSAPAQYLPLFWDKGPWEEARREGANVSGAAMNEWILSKYPQAEVKMLLDERVNLSPGHRCPGFSSWGEMPILGRFVKTILRDSPIQPSGIKFMYKGEERYLGLAVNNHREGIQLAFNSPMRRTVDEALNRHNAGCANYAMAGGASGGCTWGNSGGADQHSGYCYQIRLIEASPDNITLKPGEVLDISKPPLMSISKFNASLPPSSAPVEGVATLGSQKSEVSREEKVLSAFSPDVASATLTGTVYHEDGTTPFVGASVYVRQTVHKLTGQNYQYFGPVRTDAHGKYRIDGLPLQKVAIRAFADKMHPDGKELTLDVDKPGTQDFILIPTAAMSGKVIAPGEVDAVYLNLDSDSYHVHGIVTPNPDGSYLMVLAESLEFEIDDVKQYEQQGQQSWHWIKKRDGAKASDLPESIEYKLTARARGYETIEIPEVSTTLGEETSNIDILPTQPTGSISGKLVDEKGEPVAGMGLALATVTFEANGGRGYSVWPLDPKAASQADGSFIFNDATEGYHRICPKADFSQSGTKEFPKYTFGHKRVVVPRGQAVTGIKIVVKPNPTIRVTGRILKSDGKTPIANAEMMYRYRQVCKDGGGGSGKHTFYTDGEGRYLFKDDEAATYYLTVMFNDASATHNIKAKEGEHIKGVDFVIPDTPDQNAVRGRVLSWDDKQPISTVGVSLQRKRNLFGNGELNYGAWTNEHGYFQCLGMEDGRYTVTAKGHHSEFMPSDVDLLPQSVARITVKNGVGGEVDLYLLRGGSISGKVFSEATGELINEAHLKKSQIDDGNVPITNVGYGTNVNGGKYELRGLKPGAYAITLEAEGYHPLERGVELAIGQKVIDVDFALQPTNGRSIAGVVLLTDGTPVPNVMISLFRGYKIPQGSQTISPDGQFQFDNLPLGKYKVVLNASGFPEQAHTLEIAKKSVTDLKLQLVKGGSVSGRIIAPKGSHLPEKPVVIVGTDGYAKGEWTSSGEIGDKPFDLRTDTGHYTTCPSETDLTFKIENILPGEYWAILWEDVGRILSLDGERLRAPVVLPQKIEVKEGAETQVELQLPRYGKIEGKILDTYTGAPVADARVAATSTESRAFSRGTVSDAEGKYSIEVVLGKYKKLEVLTWPLRYAYAINTDEFIVKEGQTVRTDIKLIAGATVTGRITIPGGITPDVRAMLFSEDEGGFFAEVKSDGTYKAQHVSPGPHTVRLEVYDEEKGKTRTLMKKDIEVKDKEVKTGVDFVVGR